MMTTLFLLFSIFGNAAKADILFIDTNNSPKEVAAAKEAAKKSKRSIYVFPNNSPQKVKGLERLQAEYRKLTKDYDKVCKTEGTPECILLTEKVTKKNNEITKAQAEMTLDVKQLETFLQEREKNKEPLTSIVVSGHDGTGSFSGATGMISDIKLAELFAPLPLLRDNIRSLHLWGCYTTSPGSLMLNWKKHFPNTALISGYEGRAPLGDKPAGWQYLKGVLAAEPKLLEIGDHNKLQQALKKLPGALITNAAIAVCDSYASIKESFSLAEMTEQCQRLKIEIKEKSAKFDCYLRATQSECADPPNDTSAGEVREFYEILQKASACEGLTNDAEFRTYSRDQALRLIFAKEVQRNFVGNYGKELAEVDELLKKLGAPESLRFSALDSLSRKDLIARTQELQNFLVAKLPDAKIDPINLTMGEQEGALVSLNQFHQAITSTLVNLDQCVPFDWVEPNDDTPSNCINKEAIGFAGVTYALANPLRGKKLFYRKIAEKLEKQISDLENSDKPISAMEERVNVLRAKADLLVFLGNKNIKLDKVESPQEKAAKMKLAWAEIVLKKSLEKIQDPEKNTEALKMAREYHEHLARLRAKEIPKEINYYSAMEANDNAFNQADNKKRKEILELKKPANDLKIEILRLMKSTNTDDLKTAAILRKKLGEQLLVIRVKEYQAHIGSINDILNTANVAEQLTPENLSNLQRARKAAEDKINALMSRKEVTERTLAEEQLDTIEVRPRYTF